MSALAEVERLLTHLSRAEKAQVLRWTVSDLGDADPARQLIRINRPAR
jgi:hypothetical protein